MIESDCDGASHGRHCNKNNITSILASILRRPNKMAMKHLVYSLEIIILCGLCITTGTTDFEVEDGLEDHGKCEPITITMCTHLPYNRTMMPNLLRHQKQEEAALEIRQYMSLVKIHCSPDLQFFLCLMYAPVCTILEKPLPPCRSICERAKAGCERIMRNFGFQWPPSLDCSKLPEFGDDPEVLCVGNNDTSPSRSSTTILPSKRKPQKPEFNVQDKQNSIPSYTNYTRFRDRGFVCPTYLQVPTIDNYELNFGTYLVKDCGAPCPEMFFRQPNLKFARVWIGAWALLCAISCFFTFLTFLIDTDRFRYPERPIIFLSLCYLMVALVYVIGWTASNTIACTLPFSSEGLNQQKFHIITQGTKHELCTLLFMVLYFFGMASSIWWVVLTLTWFLAAGLKWGHEAIEANSQYFHLAAWAVPAVKTVIILALGKVDGDVLSGVCYVGLYNVDTLRGFVLAPLCVYLVLGTIFLLAGFVSLFRIRTVMKHDGTKTDKLEQLMIRIGIFSVLYTVPALIVIACLFYEQAYFYDWMTNWHHSLCEKKDYAMPCQHNSIDSNMPMFDVFMIKYLMAMIVGITSSFWVWSSKTVTSWRQFLNHIRGRRVEAYV